MPGWDQVCMWGGSNMLALFDLYIYIYKYIDVYINTYIITFLKIETSKNSYVGPSVLWDYLQNDRGMKSVCRDRF